VYPGVELRLYRYVALLAEELNFTRAAARGLAGESGVDSQAQSRQERKGGRSACG